jgi:valyl-tRNA synthetase
MPQAVEAGRDYILKLAYASELTVTDKAPENTEDMAVVTTPIARCFMPMSDLVDMEKERERKERELQKAEAELARVLEKLGNERFVSRAPENVVQAEREKEIKLRALIEKLKA